MQTLLFPTERAKKNRTKQRTKQTQKPAKQLELNTCDRVNQKYASVGSLPVYLREPTSAQSEIEGERLIYKIAHRLRRISDAKFHNETQETKPMSYKWVLEMKDGKRVILRGYDLVSAAKEKWGDLASFMLCQGTPIQVNDSEENTASVRIQKKAIKR